MNARLDLNPTAWRAAAPLVPYRKPRLTWFALWVGLFR